MNTETFSQMVQRLFKEMGSPQATLIHASVGMTGEVAELLKGVVNADLRNIVEELGDFRFYMEKVMLMHGWDIMMFNREELKVSEGVTPLDQLIIQSGEVQDVFKKSWVHGKPVDTDKLFHEFGKLVNAYIATCAVHEMTDPMVCAVNMCKLSTGPNARYPLGYTDEAAIVRADKVAEEAVRAEVTKTYGAFDTLPIGDVVRQPG